MEMTPSSPDVNRLDRLPRTPGTPGTPQTQAESTQITGDIAHDLGMIPLSAGVNKYVGSSSGFSIAKLVLARADQANGSHQLGSIQSDETTAETRCQSMFTIGPSALPTSKSQAVQLSQIFFEQVHPRYPFLHRQSHYISLDAVYSSPATATKPMKFQVTMVLAISATILSRRLRIPFSGEGLCAAAMEFADQIDFQSSPEGVQSLLLISMFTLHSPFLGINPWYLNYQCIAAVIDLGLQQDIPVAGSVDAFEREMRTRIFWVVFSIDRIIATTLGRPVGVRDESCDLRLPLGLEDQDLDGLRDKNHIEGQMSSASTSEPAALACAVVHFKLALLNSEIMYALHSVSANAPQHTYPRIPDVESWQGGLYDRLVAIHREFPTFGNESKHFLALCEVRYHEIVMLLFRPTPRIRSPGQDSLTHCYQSAEATIRLWKELYNSDRMSYSWTSIHSICLSGITILYCIWMVRELSMSIEIDNLSQTMMAASNLLSAAGEHWTNARRCRNSLNNLTAATVRWLVNLRSKPDQPSVPTAPNGSNGSHGGVSEVSYIEQQPQVFPVTGNLADDQPLFNSEWVDMYINGDDIASLFRTPTDPSTTDLSLMEGMFTEYQPLFDFYQGNEFGM